jgi:hypothetical protein
VKRRRKILSFQYNAWYVHVVVQRLFRVDVVVWSQLDNIWMDTYEIVHFEFGLLFVELLFDLFAFVSALLL